VHGPLICVIEDDEVIASSVAARLRAEGFAVEVAHDGPGGVALCDRLRPDLIVLDVMLPGLDGFEVLRRLREDEVWTPVLMLTARDAVTDRVRGLDLGADDYLVKPFAFTELVSRVRALIRRGAVPCPVVMRCGPLELEPATRAVAVSGTGVELSAREFALLELLLQRQGRVVTRTEILDHVWDASYEGGSNVVDVYIKYLRDKVDRPFGVDLIHTVRGFGYRLAVPS
jgi:two-component system, OmpR family, response regulator